ncbi:alcohol dehydrogenase, putative [Paecilomyces variotii No. 5]|uniref:Alcohol dehydrogenase, putative n=1 Tax=Byssochlamys spectabilis (strain No. 5 / NBRC 109023) TaxID=1356009 RepID=V5HYK6_BYSSN|nr:alcohol dehydrogenase, putative [Paecilomyces variotii No. 5]
MPVPESFKAAVVAEPGAQNIVQDRSLPPLETGEVAIRITATAVNPVDWKMRDWEAFIDKYPAVLGSDAAGEIAEVGPNVSGFAVGDRVFFQGIIGKYDYCTFQQYCKMPASLVSKTPKNITDEQAAGIALATVAVVTAYYDVSGHALTPPWEKGGAEAGKGKAIVILGGASSVGQYAIQLARLSGFDRIITNASPANHEFLKTLGAHVVLDRSRATVEDFQAAVGELPLDFLFDAISSSETQRLGVKIVRAAKTITSNHVVTVHTVRPDTADPEATALSQSKEPKVQIKRVLGIGSSPDLRYLSEPMAKSLGGEDGYIAKGLYIPNRPRVVPGGLGAVEEALGLNRKGVSGEKVVFRPSET